jgi:uncharacterized protein YndB with AHSA1/START domain
MDRLQLTQVPTTRTGMLIRKSVAEVFEAFVDPAITAKFWFTKGSGRLEVGKQVRWDWEMYGISVPVTVKAVESNKRLVIEWPGATGVTTVEWTFSAQKNGTTFVSITEAGFTGSGDELVKQVTDSTQGFTLVLAGLKALLEHDVRLNLVPDRYPPSRRSWMPAALLVGVVYLLVGRLFALPASHVRAWRLAAWLVSGGAYAAHIGFEHLRLRNSPRSTALHVAVAVAIGAFALAVAGMVHSLLTAATIRPAWLLALVIWPAVTAVPAFIVALVGGTLLARRPRRTDAK